MAEWWNNPEHTPARRAVLAYMRARLRELYEGDMDDPETAARFAQRATGWDKQIATLYQMAQQDDPPYPSEAIRHLTN